jgi:hypothetical protein
VAWTRCSAVRSCDRDVARDEEDVDRHQWSARADCRRADVLLTDAFGCRKDAAGSPLDREGVSGELLAEADGHGILHVGPTGLEDAVERHGPILEGGHQLSDRRQQQADAIERGDTHRGRKDVVGGLGHVDVIVGADDRVVTAPATADTLAPDLDGSVGQHLIGVHVVADAGSGLEGVDRKASMRRAWSARASGVAASGTRPRISSAACTMASKRSPRGGRSGGSLARPPS